MGKSHAGFSDDLQAIQGEVEADVGTILEIARRTKDSNEPGPAAYEKVQVSARPKNQPSDPPRPRKPLQPSAEPQPQLLQNVTTRLSHQTNILLTEASLRQRLNKSTPATRQDIIEAAVQAWLHQHGYHKSVT